MDTVYTIPIYFSAFDWLLFFFFFKGVISVRLFVSSSQTVSVEHGYPFVTSIFVGFVCLLFPQSVACRRLELTRKSNSARTAFETFQIELLYLCNFEVSHHVVSLLTKSIAHLYNLYKIRSV